MILELEICQPFSGVTLAWGAPPALVNYHFSWRPFFCGSPPYLAPRGAFLAPPIIFCLSAVAEVECWRPPKTAAPAVRGLQGLSLHHCNPYRFSPWVAMKGKEVRHNYHIWWVHHNNFPPPRWCRECNCNDSKVDYLKSMLVRCCTDVLEYMCGVDVLKLTIQTLVLKSYCRARLRSL